MNIETYKLPHWALIYLIYGDASGLNDEEKELIDSFVDAELAKEGIDCFHVTAPTSEPYFSYENDLSNFGCDVYDVPVIVSNKN